MDKIQKAIQRAREEGHGNIGKTGRLEPGRANPSNRGPSLHLGTSQSAQSRQPHAAGTPAEHKPRKQFRYHDNPEYINYTKTVSKAVDEHTLLQNRVIAGINRDPRTESYRQLRTQVRKILDDNGWTTLAITSANDSAGKTLTATNLAIALSRELNHTVLLVDLDLRQPSVHKTLGIEVEYGLVDVLQRKVGLEQVLVNPGFQRLVVLPGRHSEQYASEILSSPAMTGLVDDIRTRYATRIIIFDLPPLLRNDDAMLFAPSVEATLLVVEQGVTTADDLLRCNQLLGDCNLIGTVFNKVKGRSG